MPYLSIIWAINFRRAIGGENRVMQYCRSLALEGGQAMADILGTQLLDNTPNRELTSAMVSGSTLCNGDLLQVQR